MTYCKIKPVCNQIELNPQCTQTELVKFCLAKDIRPVAYSPVARPSAGGTDLRINPYLMQLAWKHGKSTVQIMLNWGLCKGHVVIPKAANFEHQLENLDVFDF